VDDHPLETVRSRALIALRALRNGFRSEPPGRLSWRRFLLVGLLIVNAVLVAVTLAAFFLADPGVDWQTYVVGSHRVFGTGLYDWQLGSLTFRYSPVAAYAFAVIAPIGFVGWLILHFAALATLPRRLALFTVISFPFWSDVYNGNLMTFVYVAAATALAGSEIGTILFFAFTLLAPRPLMFPITIWLLWRRPRWRPWFVGMFAGHAALVLATGEGPAWIHKLLATGGEDISTVRDWGPVNIIGPWWFLLGLLAAAWLLWRGRLGLASLAASPYWLAPYLLMALLELGPTAAARHADAIRPRSPNRIAAGLLRPSARA
jgi:hypothetical protein